jgi:hypothetical protein
MLLEVEAAEGNGRVSSHRNCPWSDTLVGCFIV